MHKKRLCLLISTMGPGGMQRVMSVLANQFVADEETEVHLILYGISKEIFYPLKPEVIIHVPSFRFSNKKRFYNTIKTLFFVRRRIKALKPDSILSYGEYWNSFILISLLGFSFPVFISDRCQPDKSLGTFHNWLRKILYPRAKGIVAQTETAKSIYREMLKHPNIRVIGNPIQNPGFINEIEKENIVLTIGRLIPSKHHDLLIDIFLESYQPGWKLVIVGGDVAYENRMKVLTDKIRFLNAEDKVILAGNTKNVADYYQKSKIFAFASSSEGFPNVIGEAMAAGIPVVAFDCVAGPSDLIVNGVTGFLIPLYDKAEYVEKLTLLMCNEQLQIKMGDASMTVIRKFTAENISQKYYNFVMSESAIQHFRIKT